MAEITCSEPVVAVLDRLPGIECPECGYRTNDPCEATGHGAGFRPFRSGDYTCRCAECGATFKALIEVALVVAVYPDQIQGQPGTKCDELFHEYVPWRPVEDFLRDACERDAGAEPFPLMDLYRAFEAWWPKDKQFLYTLKRFFLALKDVNVERSGFRIGKRMVHGLRIKPEFQPKPDTGA